MHGHRQAGSSVGTSFGDGRGILAKTDAIDAHLLARFGEKTEPPIRPITVGVERRMADLVARRRQIVSMIVAEKNRREFRILGVTQPRVSDLVRGKIDLFSIEMLVNMLAKTGLQVTSTTRVRKRVA